MHVYWYYNRRYSETGGVYTNITDAIDRLKKDTSLSRSLCRKILRQKKLDDFNFSIKRVPYYGSRENLTNSLYGLRYPCSIHDSKMSALKIRLIEVLMREESYYWSVTNDFHRQIKTKCDLKWLKLVAQDDQVQLNLTDALSTIKCSDTWQRIWHARISQDEWSSENHIELIDEWKQRKKV